MSVRYYTRKHCPLLFALLERELPGDTPLSDIPGWLNRRLGPWGLKPLNEKDEVAASCDRVERFLEDEGFYIDDLIDPTN